MSSAATQCHQLLHNVISCYTITQCYCYISLNNVTFHNFVTKKHYAHKIIRTIKTLKRMCFFWHDLVIIYEVHSHKKIQILNFKDMHIKQEMSLDGNILNGINTLSLWEYF